jgi:hypothetical protein
VPTIKQDAKGKDQDAKGKKQDAVGQRCARAADATRSQCAPEASG